MSGSRDSPLRRPCCKHCTADMTVQIAGRTLVIPPHASAQEKLALLARLKRSIVGSQSVKLAAIKAGAVQPYVQLESKVRSGIAG